MDLGLTCDIQYVIPAQGTESPQNGLYNQLKLIGINEINQNIRLAFNKYFRN